MINRRFQLVVITLIASSMCVVGEDLRPGRRIASESNWNRFLQYVEPAVKSAGGIGRLYYHADCWTSRGDDIFFPSLKLELPTRPENGLAALRDIFRQERGTTIAQDRSTITRISVGSVSHELLDTKIHVLALEPSERFNPREAISAIQRTKEVQAKMRELRLEEPPVILSGNMADPAPGLPHLPALIKDVTMDEALDRVAQTFGGLVTYGECSSAKGTRLVFVDFVYIR